MKRFLQSGEKYNVVTKYVVGTRVCKSVRATSETQSAEIAKMTSAFGNDASERVAEHSGPSVYETVKTPTLASPNGSPRNSAAFARGVLESAFAAPDVVARLVDVVALTARNRDLGCLADRARVRAAEQSFCLQQAIHVRALGVVMSLGELGAAQCGALAHLSGYTNKIEAAERVVEHAAALVGELEQYCCVEEQCVAGGDESLHAIERTSRANAVSGMIHTLRNIQTMCTDLQKMQDERDANLKHIYDAMVATFTEHFDVAHFGIVLDRCALRHQNCDICGNEYNCNEPARQQLLLGCCQLKQSCCVECLTRIAYTNSNFARKLFFHCAFCRTELRLYGQFEPEEGAR